MKRERTSVRDPQPGAVASPLWAGGKVGWHIVPGFPEEWRAGTSRLYVAKTPVKEGLTSI